MIRALYSAASGMTAQQLNIDNIANNLANSNTVGYKTRRAQFQDLMYQTTVQPGSQAGASTVVPTGLQLGLGVRAASNEIIFQQGDFSNTGNPLDMVIQGNGFFQIKLPNGDTAYTRAGQFQLDSTGNVVDGNGNPLQPQIAIPAAAQASQNRHRWNGQLYPAAAGRVANGRADLAGELSESGRTELSRPKLLSAHRRFRRGADRPSRRLGRNWHHSAGLCRAVECQRRG